ncbi:MAG: ParB N-terminal domain-containing protein [Pelagibacterales bacterium]|nr:ParB N-terminal domain-containing protein [Pelagibacterales bacterium]
MQHETIKIDKIRESKFNPSVRVDRKSIKYKQLRKNIKDNGLIVPLILSNSGVIIDGHRRYNCLLDLNVTDIPVIIHTKVTDKTYDMFFVAANENSMSITAAQEVERYLSGAKISKRIFGIIKELEDIAGRPFIKRINADKKSPTTYWIAINQFKRYTKKTNRLWARKVVYWMLNVGSAYQLKAAIGDFIPVDTLLDAINNKQSIKRDWYLPSASINDATNSKLK